MVLGHTEQGLVEKPNQGVSELPRPTLHGGPQGWRSSGTAELDQPALHHRPMSGTALLVRQNSIDFSSTVLNVILLTQNEEHCREPELQAAAGGPVYGYLLSCLKKKRKQAKKKRPLTYESGERM